MENIPKTHLRSVVTEPGQDLLVCVATPCTGTIQAVTAQCISDLLVRFSVAKYDQGDKAVLFRPAQCSMLTAGRHRLVKIAGDLGATHMLWVDSDMMFPSDALHRLLSHGKSIVGCNYARKTYPHWPTAALGKDVLLFPDYVEANGDVELCKPAEPLKKVMHLGFGCVLVNMDVYNVLEEKFGQPYFCFEPIYIDGEYRGDYGEDNYFFRKCREAGYDVWCDQELSLEVKHEGYTEYDLSFCARGHHMESEDENGVSDLQRAQG